MDVNSAWALIASHLPPDFRREWQEAFDRGDVLPSDEGRIHNVAIDHVVEVVSLPGGGDAVFTFTGGGRYRVFRNGRELVRAWVDREALATLTTGDAVSGT